MYSHRHLVIEEVNLPPSTEWKSKPPGWRFVRITHGVAYWLSPGSNQEVSSGGLIVLAPHGAGSVLASKLGDVRLHYFHFCPETLSGFLTLAERQQLEALAAQQRPAVQFLTSTHPVATQFTDMLSHAAGHEGLFLRCEVLFLVATYFAEDLSRSRPPATKSTFALHRFRQIIQQMPDSELIRHAPEDLARMCGCSVRHFGRLFRRHFGAAIRAKQIELRLLKARQILAERDSKVIEVAMECGYRSLGLFNAMFKKHVGMTPTQWRRSALKKMRAPKTKHAAAIILAILLPWSLSAAEAPPQLAVTNNATEPPKTAAPATNAPAAKPAAPTFEVTGYEITGNTLLPRSVLEQVLTNSFGPAVTFDAIRKALGELQLAYRDRGFVTVAVTLPPQELTNGLVKVQVTQGVLTEVNVVNNRYFSSNNVMRALPSVRTNTVLNGLVFGQELDRANNNKDRQIYPVIGPGPEPGTSSLNLKVKDRLPWHGRIELNNASTPDTPELRLNLSTVYNNLWQLEHQFGAQYSFTPTDLKEGSYPFYDKPLIANYSAYYRLPLSGVNGARDQLPYDLGQFGYDEAAHRFRPPPAADVNELLVYASRSSSDTGMQLQAETLNPTRIPPAGGLQVSDRLFNDSLTIDENIGTRLLHPLPAMGPLRSSLSMGPDFKRHRATSDQTRVFQATLYVPEVGNVGPPFTTFKSPPTMTSRSSFNAVDYFPLSLNWDASVADKYGITFFNINNTFQWNGFFGGKSDFQAITFSTNVTGTYYQGNYGITRDQKISGEWGVRAHADGQYATETLISTEQIGLGGNAGPRGYRDGQIYGDLGWRLQLEPHTPSFNLGLVDAKAPMFVRFYTFMDYAMAYRAEHRAFGPNRVELWGTGVGLSGNIGEHIDFRFAVGFPLLALPGLEAGQPRVTFAVGGTF
jgi:hemolysin activation/secretion protein/AraC-like DNA-binding protein